MAVLFPCVMDCSLSLGVRSSRIVATQHNQFALQKYGDGADGSRGTGQRTGL
jgi:hypothetical protein